ncbi:MAG: alpha-amylase [Clostridia bacterium]|nr:alpha-amylase [Clostridia bacterium]
MKRFACLLLALALLMGAGAAAPAEGPAASGVAYEIFVGSFADSDGDGLGDLRGIEEKLDYIASLGVDMIWLTPIHPSPSYHHYDVTDYYAVAPEFGALEDFDSLVAACRERGIGVILDLVVNHTGVGHPWFSEACAALAGGKESPAIEMYTFTQGSGDHEVPGASGWYYEGRFGPHMPDLNLDNEDVRGEIARIIAFWQEHGVSGFRLDATTSYYTGAPGKCAEFVRFICETARAKDPDCYVVGECWADAQTILGMYSSGIDSLFNFPAADVDGLLVQAALNGRGAAVARRMAEWNGQLRAASPASLDAPFLTNHDIARARGMLRSDEAAMKAAAMLYLLLPGRPFVYYGEELGMSGSGRDENKRLPMLWSAADETANCLPPADADQKQRLKAGVAEQEGNEESLLNWYRALIALRSLAPELARGEMTALDAGNDAVCAFTVEDGTTAIVLVNASKGETVSLDLAALGLDDAALLGCVGVPAEDFLADAALPPLSCALLRAE